jgi:transposase InsO family protein
MGVHVSERLVAVLMSMNRIAGLPSVGKVKRLRGVVRAGDLVNRKFHRSHPMNYGSMISPSIQRAKARSTAAQCLMHSVARIIGWSIDTVQDSNLVVNALDMAIKNRNPSPGGVVHGRSRRAIHIMGIYQQN